MDQQKIGRFIAENRKRKKLTQVELAEKLGVTDRAVSKWETGRCMPDLSLFEPLCDELGITINELLSGENIKEEEYQKELEKNLVNTIDYSNKQVEKQKRNISLFVMIVGVLISTSSFILFSPESSWSSIYSVVGILLFVSGVWMELKATRKRKKLGISILIFVLMMTLFYAIDFAGVMSFHRAPIYRYKTITEWQGDSKIITYDSIFYQVFRINADTQNEYYMIDAKKEYDSNTIPVSPFDREKSGIDQIVEYKNPYIGNNSNIGNLLSHLPLSEYGYVFEIDSENYGLTVDYHTTDWYQNENLYINKAMLYNSVSIFMLIDNVNDITFQFSGGTYKVTKAAMKENFPDYEKVIQDGKINKDNFNKYVEHQMNDNTFVEKVFARCFAADEEANAKEEVLE